MNDHPIILFDGVCNLCNRSVQFIIRRDLRSVFRFAALQSVFGNQQLVRFGIPSGMLNSIVLVAGGKAYQKSDAALAIAQRLGGRWRAMILFKVVPRVIRDWVYDWIAVNRYRFFGRQDQCMIPTPELKARFLQ